MARGGDVWGCTSATAVGKVSERERVETREIRVKNRFFFRK
jgi:hypothetical protein